MSEDAGTSTDLQRTLADSIGYSCMGVTYYDGVAYYESSSLDGDLLDDWCEATQAAAEIFEMLLREQERRDMLSEIERMKDVRK